MEFLDEYESRPRFVFQSKQLPLPSSDSGDGDLTSSASASFSSLHKPTLFISLSLSILIFVLAFVYNDSEPLKSLLLWLAFSLLLGPFAPPSLTAGDIRVGVGPPIKETPKVSVEINEKSVRKTPKPQPQKKSIEDSVGFDGVSEKSTTRAAADRTTNRFNNGSLSEDERSEYEEREWSEADEELLRKLMKKHPVGKPGRWEVIAEEGFKGKHKMEYIIMKAKGMGEKKMGDQDSYKKFLKDRKPPAVIDEAANGGGNGIHVNNESVEDESGRWTAGEDLALLNALKAFPKEVAMRWEKIAAAVPAKTKSSCMKRVTELKKGFRSSKASSGQAS